MKNAGWNEALTLEYLRFIESRDINRLVMLLDSNVVVEVAGERLVKGLSEVKLYFESLFERLPSGWNSIDVRRLISDDHGVAVETVQRATDIEGNRRSWRFVRFFGMKNRLIADIAIFPGDVASAGRLPSETLLGQNVPWDQLS